MLLKSLICLLLAFGSFAGSAQEHQGVAYAKPAGWEEATQGGAKVFSPKGLKDGQVMAILLMPAIAATEEPLSAQFKKLVDAANEGAKLVGKGEPMAQEKGDSAVHVQAFELDSPEVGKHSRLYAMVHSAKQNVLVIVISNSDALLEKHGDAVTTFIASIGFKSSGAKPKVEPAPGAGTAPPAGKIPTGDTPDLFAGMPGWLPSGKGHPIPAAGTAGGKPVGLWWKVQVDTRGLLQPIVHIYMPNGVRASNPRLGGPKLFDQDGQSRQRGMTGLGDFKVEGGQLVERYDGFENRGPYRAGTDADGAFFKIGEAMFRPVVPLTKGSVVGTWRALSSEFKFKADGTFESGSIASNGDWTSGSFVSGTYTIDGFLLMLVPKGAPVTVNFAGMGGLMLIKNGTFYVKS